MQCDNIHVPAFSAIPDRNYGWLFDALVKRHKFSPVFLLSSTRKSTSLTFVDSTCSFTSITKGLNWVPFLRKYKMISLSCDYLFEERLFIAADGEVYIIKIRVTPTPS